MEVARGEDEDVVVANTTYGPLMEETFAHELGESLRRMVTGPQTEAEWHEQLRQDLGVEVDNGLVSVDRTAVRPGGSVPIAWRLRELYGDALASISLMHVNLETGASGALTTERDLQLGVG